ncbi:MAG TPA: histidine kinase [Longimicrobiales bacterium]|nr:histidine kinase [Longimicrobiales bacterium]
MNSDLAHGAQPAEGTGDAGLAGSERRIPLRRRVAGLPVRPAVALLVAATAVGVVEATQYYAGVRLGGGTVTPWRAIESTVPSWYVFAALVPGIVWLAKRFRVERGRWGWVAPHVVASVVFVVIHLSLTSYVSDFVLARPSSGETLWADVQLLLSVYFVLDVVMYWAVLGVYYAFDYYRRFRERERTAAQLELKASRLEAGLATANLQALRMQLNPHFLFNTLNSISVLALKGEKQKVARMLARLSELLRVALENSSHVIPLSQELEFLERYLDIEQLRFQDRLEVVLDLAPEVLDAEVPSLILQPLVENAIAHGVARNPGPGRVSVRGGVEGSWLVLKVCDTGPGFRPEPAPGPRRGIGLANTRLRLEQLYGAEQSIDVANAPDGGAIVTLHLPFRPAPDPLLRRGGEWATTRAP